MAPTKILAGTSKGLVVSTRDGQHDWVVSAVHFTGMPVSMVYCDERSAAWWVGLSHRHWGQKLYYTNDQGRNWHQVDVPAFNTGTTLPSGRAASMKKIWCMQHAGIDRPGGVWIGTEPGALFYSADNGQTFDLVTGLWNHPSRKDGSKWFGAGRDYSFIHSIVVDSRNSSHVYIAVSCAGVFETWDAGTSWKPLNKGLLATYLPDHAVDVGHDPHLLLACESDPDVLWQQNHCGIFRSVDGGENWIDVSDHNGLANYGFALAIDNVDPKKAWIVPAKSDVERIPNDLALCVCHTDDAGNTWKTQRNGLPQKYCFDLILRHSLVKVDRLMAFGTSSGSLFVSLNEGENWTCISRHLSRIETVVIVN